MNATVLQNLVDIGHKERAAQNIAAIVYIIIVCSTGIVGNIAAIVFFSLKRPKSTSTILMIVLPANDLCVNVAQFTSIAFSLHTFNFPYIELYQIYFFTAHALNMGSLIFILVIAVDRYRLVVLMKQFRIKSLAFIVAGVYMYTFMSGSKYFFLSDNIPVNITVKNVTFDAVEIGIISYKYPFLYWFTFVMDSVTFVMVITVSAVLYWRLFKKLKNNAKRLRVHFEMTTRSSCSGKTQVPKEQPSSSYLSMDETPTQSDGNVLERKMFKPDRHKQTTDEPHTQKNNKKVNEKHAKTNRNKNKSIQMLITKMMFCVTVASFVSYIPSYILLFTTEVGETYDVPGWQKVLYRSYMLSTSINPYIIGYFNKDFRRFLKIKIFRCFPG